MAGLNDGSSLRINVIFKLNGARMLKVRKVVIPVAGLGTRLLPASKAIPKEMMPVVDKPVIQYVIEESIAAGIKEIILVTRSGKSAIEDHFDSNYELEKELARKNKLDVLAMIQHIVPFDVSIVSVRQHEAKGLGHAVSCAASLIGDEPFAVILPDVLINNSGQQGVDLARMVAAFECDLAPQIMVGDVSLEDVHLYGIVDCGGVQPKSGASVAIKRLVEKPSQEQAPSTMAVIGRYILPARIMALLAEGKAGAGGEIQLTDAIDALLLEQQVQAYRMQGASYDCGDKLGYVKANIAYGLQHDEIGADLNLFLKTLG